MIRLSTFVLVCVFLLIVVVASLLGWLLAEMLIAMMQHAFDPPPDHLAISWGFLGALTLVVVVGAALAAIVAERSIARLPLGAVLREE